MTKAKSDRLPVE